MLRILPLAAAALIALGGVCRADEFTDQLDLVRQYYDEGDYAAAAAELQFALEALRARLAEQYAATFPEPPEGWQAEDVETQGGAAFMGGGVVLRRTYSDGAGASIEAQLVADNPMVQGFSAMLANPAVMAAQPGAKRVRIGRANAILVYDADARTGEATLVIGRAMIRLEGRGLDGPEPLEALLRSWDIRTLRDLAG